MARHRCAGDDGTPLVVIEQRHVFTIQSGESTRHHRGAAWSTLLDGEPVRYIDACTFEVIATGELLRHDRHGCDCMPAARISTSSDGGQNAT